MSHILKQNKFFLSCVVIAIVLGGMTLGNIPPAQGNLGIQTIDGLTFNFADYPVLTHEQIAIINYFDRLVTATEINLWNGWNAENYLWAVQYVAAFTAYTFAAFSETTSGYRTEFYENFAQTLIQKMNTSVADYGNESMEYYEWNIIPGFTDYYYPNATHPDADDVYTGGFRGPAMKLSPHARSPMSAAGSVRVQPVERFPQGC